MEGMKKGKKSDYVVVVMTVAEDKSQTCCDVIKNSRYNVRIVKMSGTLV